MKYEEWIKYEEARQAQPPELAWMVFVEFPVEESPPAILLEPALPADDDKTAPRIWSLIVQHLNPKKI